VALAEASRPGLEQTFIAMVRVTYTLLGHPRHGSGGLTSHHRVCRRPQLHLRRFWGIKQRCLTAMSSGCESFGCSLSAGHGMSESEQLVDSAACRYCYKVLPCVKRAAHEWTTCPWAHPGEQPGNAALSYIACSSLTNSTSDLCISALQAKRHVAGTLGCILTWQSLAKTPRR
jgi:hypothetical protein